MADLENVDQQLIEIKAEIAKSLSGIFNKFL